MDVTRPTSGRWLAASAVGLLVLAGAGLGPGVTPVRAQPDPSQGIPATADPTPANDVPAVSLSGPFGILDGLPIATDAPLPDPSPLRPLDGYGRGAALLAAPRDMGLTITSWQLTATAEAGSDAASSVVLGTDPDSAGEYVAVPVPPEGAWLVRLDATLNDADHPFNAPGISGSWVWRLVVPDRDVPADGPYPPLPDLVLSGGGSWLAMELGSGCFIGTCGDVGNPTPDAALPVLQVAAGAPMRLGLADGSGLAAWRIGVRAVGDHPDDLMLLVVDTLGVGRPVATFRAPGGGDWVIEAHVTFDLERGAVDASARLVIP